MLLQNFVNKIIIDLVKIAGRGADCGTVVRRAGGRIARCTAEQVNEEEILQPKNKVVTVTILKAFELFELEFGVFEFYFAF